jgi:serine/threonine protein kinase
MIGKKGRFLGRDRQYRLVRLMSEDALGALWRAENTFLSRPVTARVLSESLSSDPEFVARFRTTMGEVSRNLSHPNAATVFNFNWGDDGPTQFVVMEAAEGETLGERMGRVRTLEPARAIRIAAQVVDALEAAHAAGIVHGGLTPKTVTVTAEDEVKVLDFGVAAAAWDRPVQVLAAADEYAAPEWVLGAKRRPSWDVYQAAILLHHLLTGSPRMHEGSASANGWGTGAARGRDAADAAAALMPGLPPQAAELWGRALAEDPRDRPSSGALASALRTALES